MRSNFPFALAKAGISLNLSPNHFRLAEEAQN